MTGSPPPAPPPPLAGQAPAVAMVAAGGALGALARYGVGVALPYRAGEFPAATLLVNVAGCLLIGALMVGLTELMAPHPLVRLFLATGVLGGFTTFSTYAVDVEDLLAAGRLPAALGYLAGTLVAAVGATWLGIALARTCARPAGGRAPT